MFLRLLPAIHLLLLGSAMAQVGSVSSEIEKGLLAKWEGMMPLQAWSPLSLPAPAQKARLEDFAVAFAFRIEAPPAAEHETHFLSLLYEGDKPLLNFHLTPTELVVSIPGHGPSHQARFPQQLPGRWWHVALNVKRDAKQALSGLWLNGIELNSWREPSAPLMLTQSLFASNSGALRGQITGLRLYDRTLSRPEILELAAQPPLAELRPTLAPFAANKSLMTGEVVAILGGTEAVAVVEDGTLEALLVAQFPGSRIKVRDLSWEADTVFRQDRPMNFGGIPQQLQRARATAAMLMFGRQECLERGESGLAEFKTALDKLVSTCATVTPRIILVQPPPFEGALAEHNAALKKYAAAITEVAAAHGALQASQTTPSQPGSTRDGLNLTSSGATLLGTSIAQLWSKDAMAPDARLKSLIQQKNTLWHRYWRPANWAFLHGDRTAQPSSRDHADPAQRWFPTELEQYLPLIETKENEISQLANDLGGKLP
ncbi:hypothetical protein [Prosthecobacter sp.]|uniref:hypothetical protein n=1 Tax=Prosthecobacter sp. TaxID=1965333 RepID=UPI003784A98E